MSCSLSRRLGALVLPTRGSSKKPFVAKAAGAGFVLKHEGDVYGRLRSLQGVYVSIFLSAFDLRGLKRTYYYESYESEVTMSTSCFCRTVEAV